MLDQLGLAVPDRDDAEARVDEARTGYQARIDAIGAEVAPGTLVAPDGSPA